MKYNVRNHKRSTTIKDMTPAKKLIKKIKTHKESSVLKIPLTLICSVHVPSRLPELGGSLVIGDYI